MPPFFSPSPLKLVPRGHADTSRGRRRLAPGTNLIPSHPIVPGGEVLIARVRGTFEFLERGDDRRRLGAANGNYQADDRVPFPGGTLPLPFSGFFAVLGRLFAPSIATFLV